MVEKGCERFSPRIEAFLYLRCIYYTVKIYKLQKYGGHIRSYAIMVKSQV